MGSKNYRYYVPLLVCTNSYRYRYLLVVKKDKNSTLSIVILFNFLVPGSRSLNTNKRLPGAGFVTIKLNLVIYSTDIT
jgi:hypothetical protein